MNVNVVHHGGKHTVTGSCHELQLPGGSILVDCGLFQGGDAPAGHHSSSLKINFPIQQVKAMVVTHAHIDHIGRLPWLLAAGYQGPIYCTHATAQLVPLMLEDGLKLQRGLSDQQRQRLLKRIKRLIIACDYGVWLPLPQLAHLRFQPAGHILGSAYVEFRLPNDEVMVFSGDLGPTNTPLLPDPSPPQRADYLFIESTYGDSCHEAVAERSKRLLAIMDHALTDGGVILIPAFSVGRTQELLFDIEQLIHQNSLQDHLPVILDSPLASEVTKTYRTFKQLWAAEAKQRLDAQRHPLAFEQCVTIKNHREHERLVNRLAVSSEAAIVVAASGMCEGGRIVRYLQALLADERNDVLFAGYQAGGTLGRTLQEGAEQVQINNKEVKVRAQIHTMSGYSAHADQSDLLRFITGIPSKPKEVHLIHGEKQQKQRLAARLTKSQYKVFT